MSSTARGGAPVAGAYHGCSVRAADQPRAAPVREEAERPAREHEQAVLKADQVPQVDRQPGHPGQRAAEMDPFEVGDGARAADRREVALVAIAKRLGLPAGEPGEQRAGGVTSLLHRHGGEPGKRLQLVAPADRDHVAEGEHLRMPAQRQVFLHDHASRAIELAGAPASASARARPDGATPAAHTTVRAP